MKRLFTVATVVLCLCAFVATSAFAVGVAPSRLISEADANSVGLTRAWFAQATLNRDFEEVASATFQDGVFFITTTDSFLQAFDGENGTVLWTVSVGEEYLTPPAVNSRVVAVVCGERLVIYNRFNGKKLSETVIYGQPSSGPVLSERECYVPVFSEKILAYPIVPAKQEQLKVNETNAEMEGVIQNNETILSEARDKQNQLKVNDRLAKMAAKAAPKIQDNKTADDFEKDSYAIESLDKDRPFVTASFGVSLVTPVMGTQSYQQDVVSWTTEKGWIMFGQMERNVGDTPFKLLYKLQDRPNFAYLNERRLGNRAFIPRSDVEATPYFIPKDMSEQNMSKDVERREGGMIIAGSLSGHVFAMNDVTGDLRWTYLTDKPISERISAFGDYAYIPTDNGDLFSVKLENGKEAWRAQNILRTVAASPSRLYTIDTLNRLAILDRKTGRRVKTLDIGNSKFQVFNQWNDRIYIVTADGLIQCLYETQQTSPLEHRETCEKVKARIMTDPNKKGVKTDKDESSDASEEGSADEKTSPSNSGEEEEEQDVEAEVDDPWAEEDGDDVFDSFDDSFDDADGAASEEEDNPFGSDF